MFWAIRSGQEEQALILLSQGSHPLEQNLDGTIAISGLLEKKNETIFTACLDAISSWAGSEKFSLPREKQGQTFIHKLVEAKELEWINRFCPLVSSEVWSIQDDEARTPLMLAAEIGDTDIFFEILSYDRDQLVHISSRGFHPIHKLTEYNHHEIILRLRPHLTKELLSLGDSDGNNCLHLAVESDAVECLIPFLQIGVDQRLRNFRSESPLAIADREKFHHCTKILLEDLQNKIRNSAEGSSDHESWVQFARLEPSISSEKLKMLGISL